MDIYEYKYFARNEEELVVSNFKLLSQHALKL